MISMADSEWSKQKEEYLQNKTKSCQLRRKNTDVERKARNRQYPAETITCSDYADDLVLLADTPAQGESLLNSLDQAAGLHVNANKRKFMYFKWEGTIPTK